MDKYHNHNIRGNLKIIFNNKLWKLFSKCPKYWENKTADYGKSKESIITGIKSYIKFCCNKHGVAAASFTEWKQSAISAIDEKISNLSTKRIRKNGKNSLERKDEIINEKLKLLHKKYVVVPTETVSGNVSFACQSHYTQAWINELGLNNVNTIIST